ncbi:MAG: DUF6438 domain-containing protein [Saprospiraceae bacterium]|nr:DUF6438 domain-containing protein [Saprospiraceae bacterium]
MLKCWRTIVVCAIVLLLSACNKKAATLLLPPTSAVIDPSKIEEADSLAHEQYRIADSLAQPHLVIALKRTSCYGKCPVFEANVFSDGKAIYKGMNHVEMIGIYEALADTSWRSKILEKALSIQYLILADSYPIDGQAIANLPTTSTAIFINGKSKSIQNNFDAPKALIEFEAFLEKALSELNWTKVEK